MHRLMQLLTLAKAALALTLVTLLTACGQSGAPQAQTALAPAPIKVKIVVVTMFEIGEDTGDTAGEFQLWLERQGLEQKIEFPQSFHDLYFNEETGVLGMVTGMGTAKSAAAIMALGMDERFDLTQAYWLVAGIAGFDPADASIGSAAWAQYLVDGDLNHQIDAREIPEDWEFGYLPLFAKSPFDPKRPSNQGEMFQLNGELTEWAYQLTKDIPLPDDEVVAREREAYTDFPNAQKPPFVLKGDNLAAMTFWHGRLLNDWANKYVSYWTDGQGEFVSSAMEDTGTAQSLWYLDQAGRADYQRLMVLRTASNFSMPVLADETSAQSLLGDGEGFTGLRLSLEVAYAVGSTVVAELLANWDSFEANTPETNTSETNTPE